MQDYVALGVFIGLVVAAAVFGGQWGANDWYRSLRKPGFTPPDWLFPIAWSVLYLMIAFAGWYVWLTPESDARLAALGLWGAQLGVNAAWSYIFFGRKQLDVALAGISLMWALIAAFIIVTWPFERTAALLFVPYLIWVSYAAVLNAAILRMNPR